MTKMKGADAFERSLKEALESYEVPYNSADWVALEKKLGSQHTSVWQSSAGLYALFLGGAVAVMSTAWYLLNGTPQGNGGNEQIALVVNDNDERSEPAVNTFELKETPIGSEKATVEDPDQASGAATASIEPIKSSVKQNKKLPAEVPAEKPISSSTAANNEGTTGETEIAATKTITIKPSITEGCPGSTVEFSLDNIPEEGMFLWNFGDGSFSNKPTPTHTFSKAGTFEVMLSHSSVGGGNIRNKPAADRIVIHEAPEAAFNYLKQEYENTVPSVHFENRSIGGKKYVWDFGDGSTTTVAHPDHVYKKAGTYTVALTTTNAAGCIDRTERTIVIDNDYDLYAPKTFSPDGNGVEDTFIPDALKTLGARFHLSIFDSKTGALLYETTDPQRPWNGRINNKGEFCSPGDYVWLVEMKDGDKLGGTYTGNVTLVR